MIPSQSFPASVDTGVDEIQSPQSSFSNSESMGPENAPSENRNGDSGPSDAGLTVPDYVPPKFWDNELGEIRVEDLARSYTALERRLGAAEGNTVPEDASGYRIDTSLEGLEPDLDVNVRLMDAGFTQEQAQLVYDLAAEKLAPLVQQLAAETSGRDQQRRLADHFGGDDRWNTVADQIQAWGQANLSEDVFDALSRSYDGIVTLHRMMGDGEPQLVSGVLPSPRGRTEADLKKLMDDPRYWKEHDASFVADVQRGFETLYPDPE